MNREPLIRYITAIGVLGLAFGCMAQTQAKPAQKTQQGAKQQAATKQANTHTQSEGERIFAQNCSRCHTPPDGFSPRISGTIVRHMRVRASLSAHDEQELLRFFNP